MVNEEKEVVYEPVSVLDCASYVRPNEPKNKYFNNDSKSINDVDDTYTHDVTAHYGRKA